MLKLRNNVNEIELKNFTEIRIYFKSISKMASSIPTIFLKGNLTGIEKDHKIKFFIWQNLKCKQCAINLTNRFFKEGYEIIEVESTKDGLYSVQCFTPSINFNYISILEIGEQISKIYATSGEVFLGFHPQNIETNFLEPICNNN